MYYINNIHREVLNKNTSITNVRTYVGTYVSIYHKKTTVEILRRLIRTVRSENDMRKYHKLR